MSRRKAPPLVTDISARQQAEFDRLVDQLVVNRELYGKSTLFDTKSHLPRYPVLAIRDALQKIVKRAGRNGEQIELSAEELNLWRTSYPNTSDSPFKPDRA